MLSKTLLFVIGSVLTNSTNKKIFPWVEDLGGFSPVNLSEKKAWLGTNCKIIFFVFFGMIYVSGTYSEKFAQIGLGRLSQYKIFYGLLDMHIFANFSEVKFVNDILFSFS